MCHLKIVAPKTSNNPSGIATPQHHVFYLALALTQIRSTSIHPDQQTSQSAISQTGSTTPMIFESFVMPTYRPSNEFG